MRHYGLSYQEVWELPLSAFWMLNRNLSRLMAEEDKRAVTKDQFVQSENYEEIKRFVDSLDLEMGPVTIVEQPLDREGLNALKESLL